MPCDMREGDVLGNNIGQIFLKCVAVQFSGWASILGQAVCVCEKKSERWLIWGKWLWSCYWSSMDLKDRRQAPPQFTVSGDVFHY